MPMYTRDFYSDLEDRLKGLSAIGEYSVDISGGFGKVPVLEIVRALDNSYAVDIDTMDKLARYCVIGKAVTLYYDGQQVGSPFVLNSLTDPWDAFDVFNDHPMGLQYILSICAAHVLKKSIPPRKSTPLVAAGTAKEAQN